MEAKSIEFSEVLEKKEIISEEREYELLEFLDNNEGLTVYQLSKRLGWDKNVVGYYVSRLEKKNLVRIEIENNKKKIYINRESGILDMLDIDEIDPRVLVEFDKNKRD
jgi:DNA-binding MarR family transcriptional regulator